MEINEATRANASESTRLLSKHVESKENETADGGVKINNLSRTIAVLSFSLLVQSYLLVSVFPYSGFLVMHLVPSLNEENAGSYAGLIASSFMFGRTLSSFEWGKAADRYGRVFVIKTSLLLSAVISVFFGLAPTFPMALILRFLLGLCNGLIGPIKTLVSEYAAGDKHKETQMIATVLGMWGFGFLINPAMSGYLSDPVKQYPDSDIVDLFRPLLEEFPFLLPNIVGCLFCLVGYLLVDNFVEETLPEEKRKRLRLPTIFPCVRKSSAMLRTVSSWGLFKHLHNSEGEISEEMNAILSISKDKGEQTITSDEEETATIYSLMKREATRQHLSLYWQYSFLMITIDEVFPLYCISKSSGLGITEKIIGNILSGTGLGYVCIQFFLTTKLVDRFGFYNTLRIGTSLSVPLSGLMTISLITNRGAAEGTLTLSSLVFLSATYAIIRSFSSVVFSTITMTSNRTVPDNQRATMNGLSMLGGSLAKAIGPLFGGILFSTSVGTITPPFGSVVVYGVIAVLGMCLSAQAYRLREYDQYKTEPTKSVEDAENVNDDLETTNGETPPTF